MTRPSRPPGRGYAERPGHQPSRPHLAGSSPPPQRVPAVTVAAPADIRALLVTAAERDTWLRRVLAAELDGYRRGYGDGYRDGGEELYARRRAAPPIVITGPSYAELELRRWGPGGREHFGDPRPNDFRGRGGDRP